MSWENPKPCVNPRERKKVAKEKKGNHLILGKWEKKPNKWNSNTCSQWIG